MNKYLKIMSEIQEKNCDALNAICNEATSKLDEYVKNLYMKMLCTVIQYENTPNKMQISFLKRLIAGIGVENAAEDYMRMALDISETDMMEFFDAIRESNARFYFALDGTILSTLGGESTDYAYLSDILSIVDITKDEYKYICLVAKSVLAQDSVLYNEARSEICERLYDIDFVPYIQSFFTGVALNNSKYIYYTAVNRKLSESISLPTEYKANTVVFENLDIKIKSRWVFNSRENVIFRNCCFHGKSAPIYFRNIGELCIQNCEVYDFSNRFARLSNVGVMKVEKTEFSNCGYTANSNLSLGGGVFEGDIETVTLFKNVFFNCYLNGEKRLRGIIIDVSQAKEFNIIENEFKSCHSDCGATSVIGDSSAKVVTYKNKYSGQLTSASYYFADKDVESFVLE